MLFGTPFRRRLGAFAAACLLTVALPATAALAQKSKTKGETPQSETTTTEATSTAMSSEFTVDIPAIESIGSNVDDETIRAIFSGKLASNADALAGLNATSITIPTITIVASSSVGGKTTETTVTLSDLMLSDVASGVAGSTSIGGMSIDSDEGNASFGAWSASNFDIGGVLGMYGLVETSGAREMKTIYTDFTFEGGTMSAPKMSCDIGSMSAAEFKARPLNYSFAEIVALAEAMDEDRGPPAPETIASALKMYADILTAFESSPVTFSGFDCSGVDDEDRPMTFAFGGMSMNGMSPGIYPEISLDGVEIIVEGDGSVTLGNATFKAMDLAAPLAAIAALPDAVDASWFEENARALIPAFAGFSFSDLAVDVPDQNDPNERIVASIGAFDLSLADYRNGIPTDVATSASNIVVDLPEGSDDEQLQQLIALGITSIDAGFAIDLGWNEADNTISVNEVSITGADLATLVLTGTIANATEALFAIDENEMLAAAMGIAIADLSVDVTDAGLSDIIMATVAAEQGADAATMRPVFAGLAQGTIVGMLAGAADAQKVGGAVSAFVGGQAKQLTITIAAKQPPGLGMMDFMAAEDDPTVLIGKVNIDASAK